MKMIFLNKLFLSVLCWRIIFLSAGPMTDLKYPDRNLLPIFNGKAPKEHYSATLPCNIAQKSRSVYHHLHICFDGSMHAGVLFMQDHIKNICKDVNNNNTNPIPKKLGHCTNCE